MGLDETRGVSEIIEHFTDRQREAFSALFDYRYVLYGGARGGGKSRWLRWAGLLMLIYWYQKMGLKGVRLGLFCETYPDLRDRQITKITTEFPRQLGELRDSQAHGLAFHLNEANGGGILALRNLDDPAKYQSSEFAGVFVDELTKVPKETFDILRGSMRWPGIAHTVFAAGTNPGGVGHAWVKQLWIDRDFPPELRGLADQFAFVRSLPADNPHLGQTYWDDLNTLPTDLRRAWVEGDWSVFSGQAFAGWRAEHVVDPYDLPAWWPRWRAVDWGYSAPFCCLWLAKDPDNGRVFVYRELYQSGLTDRQQARLIREYSGQEKYTFTYSDPSMFSKKNTGDIATSSADEYNLEGVFLTRADNERVSGKRKVDRMLSNLPDGKPGLLVFNNCRNLIRTLPSLVYDSHNAEDIDTDQEDHAYDALRYGLSSLTSYKVKPFPGEQSPLVGIGVI